MKRLLHADNFDAWFDDQFRFISTRHEGYGEEVRRIEQLARGGTPADLLALLAYLRPWSIELEGNWIGREWVRGVAMQALCHLASQDAGNHRLLVEEAVSVASRPDEDLLVAWGTRTDSSCHSDPREDFLRCLREVLDCSDHHDDHP